MDHEHKEETPKTNRSECYRHICTKASVSSFSIWQMQDKVVKKSVSAGILAHSICIQATAVTVSSFSQPTTDIIRSLMSIHCKPAQCIIHKCCNTNVVLQVPCPAHSFHVKPCMTAQHGADDRIISAIWYEQNYITVQQHRPAGEITDHRLIQQ